MTPAGLVTFAHLVSGPLDALLELGLPLAIFVALYWWSNRRRPAGTGARPPVDPSAERVEKK